MSAALASAKKRRGGNQVQPPGLNPPAQPAAPSQSGLTLQQVITVMDRRMIALESTVKNITANPTTNIENNNVTNSTVPSNLTEVLEEYNNRFDILAEEISNLKNIILNLQSYTMDVNKVLMKERIRILSDNGDSDMVDAETATDSNVNFAPISDEDSYNIQLGM